MSLMTARLAALTLAVFLGAPAGIEFQVSYLSVHGRRMDTVTYDFDGDGKIDILNTSIDFDKKPPERWFALHLQRGGTFSDKPDFIWSVSDRACALVFGDFLPGGGTEIGFIAEDGVYVHPWEKRGPSETPVKLIHAATFFRAPSDRQIPAWGHRDDLDGDGRDDLVLPLMTGYRVYFQTAPGVFGRAANLEVDVPSGSPRYLLASAFTEQSEIVAAQFISTLELPRIEAVDINGDGLKDLVTIRKNTIIYFLQKQPGVFPSQRPFRFVQEIPTLREEVRKDTVNLTLLRFVDIDQDKLADLVVTKIEGTLGLWNSIKTSIYVHPGTGKGNFTADWAIRIDGVSIDPEFIDMNGDGYLDAVTSRLRTDLMKKAVEAFVLGDIEITYEIFQFDPATKRFFSDPVCEWPVLVRKKDLEQTGMGAVPLVFIRGDFSGDGRPDLAMMDPRTEELLIHPGVARETSHGPRIGFDGTPHWRIKVDRPPKWMHLMDLNGDGLCDVMFFYGGSVGLVLSRT